MMLAAEVRLQAERLDRAGSEPSGTSRNRNALVFGLKKVANLSIIGLHHYAAGYNTLV
jgi:hypothetical protein